MRLVSHASLRSADKAISAGQFNTLNIPLGELSLAGQLSTDPSRTLSVNGQLKVNSSFVLSPTAKPQNGVAGQMYYDRETNQLNYYNGSGFVSLTNNPQTVTSINGVSGSLTLGGGLSLNGSQLTNTGIISITSASTNLTVSDDGSGNITLGESPTSANNVQSSGGTAGRIAVFSGTNQLADSLLSQTATDVAINGGLAVGGTLSLNDGPTSTISLSSTTNSVIGQIYNDGNLHVDGGSNNLWLDAGGTGTIFLNAANSNHVAINESTIPAYPLEVNGDINITAGHSYRIGGTVICDISGCTGGGGGGSVSSLNGLTGSLTIANAGASGSTITINDASTSQKGIAQFNATNFTSTSGTINTVQNIDATAAPTFGQLTLTSAQATANMVTVNNTNGSATGNLLDLQLTGNSRFAVNPAGALTLSGTVNGQTISSAANLTGTLAVAGAANFNGGATVAGTLNANTITPSGALTVGVTSQSFLLQGNASSTITSTNGGSSTTLAFQTPTADVMYRFLTAAAGTYDVCTTAGNCVGIGGGVTTPGGTINKIAKFSGGNTISDSIITDNGSVVTIGGGLAVNTITPSASMTIGAVGQDLTLQGATVTMTSTNGASTNSLIFATPSGSNKAITIPNANGTLAVSASGPLVLDASGNLTCPTCITSSTAVTSLDGLTGAITIANSSGAGGVITVNDASTSQKGIAQFNGTNFTSAGGIVNTVQNINSTAAPTFGQLTLTSSQPTAAMLTVNNTNSGASGNLLDLQLAGTSKFAVAPSGALTLSGTINGQTISSAANFTGTLAVAGAANLNGGATVTGTLTANTITPTGALTVGATSQSFTLQGNASSTISATSGASSTTLAFQNPTASVTYRLLTATAGTYDICTSVGNCTGIGGGVTTPGGTAGTIAKFTGTGTIANSIITDNGSTVTIGGGLAVNTIAPSAAMTVGSTAQNLTLQGASVSLTSTSGGITNSIVFATPSGSSKMVTVPNASGTLAVSASGPLVLDASGNLTCPTCVTSGGGGGGVAAVDSVDGLTGAITIANSSGAGSTITINDASTSQKGLAQFNSTNFSVSSGVVNTIQDIAVSSAPTFGRLTVTSSQASSAMLLINNTNSSGTGNLIDLQLNGTSKMSVNPAGNMTLVGTVNGQTIGSAANFTGSLTVAGAANLNGGATVAGTLTANTITPSSSLTVGATGQSFLLQGSATSTITATSGANTTSLAFQAPTANVTYRFLTAAAGTYDVCTTAGNCAGVGGGVTTPGGTTNKLAKFSGSQSIADSIITDNGSTVTIGGTLAVNTLTPTAALTVGSTSQNLTLQGASVNMTSTASGITNTLAFATPSGSNKTITIPNASGTLVVSASGPLAIDSSGNISCPTCSTGANVSSLNSLTGALTIANASGSGSIITIDDASTSQKGISQFNGTNFSVSTGIVNTVQNINTSAAPTFGQLTLTSNQATAAMLTVNNTNASATGNLVDLQLNGSSKFAVSPAGALTLSGTVNGQTISSSANFTGSLTVASTASLNGGATVTGTLTANTITPNSSLTVGATNQSYTLQGNASSTISATNGANTTSLAFQNPTASVTYRLLTTAAGTYDICTTAGNCAGVGGGVTTAGGTTNKIAKFTGSQAIGDSIITDNGSTVTIGGTLAVNTITPSAAMTVGATAQNLTLQGASVSLTSTSGGITNTLTFATPSSANKTITIPNASGTVAVSASGPLALDASGNLTCPTCATTGSGVTSLNSLTGALTLANAGTAGSTITINDASTSQKGIAQFNNTNFSASSGTINTIQNINTTAAPTFGQLTLTSSQASAAMLTVNNTNASGTGNLIDLQLNGSSKFSVNPAGNVTAAGTVNGQTISSAANFTGTLAVASTVTAGGLAVNGTATVKVDSATAFQVQNSSSQSLLTVDTSGNTISLLGNNSSALSTWTTTSALSAPGTSSSTPRVRGGAIAANGYIYQLGGVDSNGATVATVQYAKQNADGTLSSWTTNSNALPNSLRQFQPVVANGYIYVIGGRDNSNAASSASYYAKLNADGSIGTWSTGLPLPSPRFGSGTVYYNGYIYVIGGFNATPTAQTTVYSAKVNADGTLGSGSWTTNTALSSTTANVNAIVANGYVYLVGGFVGGSDADSISYSKIASSGTLGTWATTSSGVVPGGGDENFETYVANGYLYAVGGDAGSRVTAFPLTGTNGAPGTAQPLTTFPGGQVGEAGMAQANGYFYVIGGSNAVDGGGTVRNSVYYTSTPRVKIGGGLDLTTYGGANANETEGNTGGMLTAGNTNIVGSLNVQDKATFAQSVTMGDTLSVAGTAAFLNTTKFSGALVVGNSSVSDQYTLRVDATDNTLKLGGANVIGNASSGDTTDSGNNGQISASKFNSGSGGTLSSLKAYFEFVQASPSNHAKVAIYSDSSGTPGTLLSSATASSTVVTVGWNTLSLGTSVSLAANTNYWLAFNIDGSGTNYGVNTGETNSAFVNMTYGSNFPSSFSATSTGTDAFSVYGVYDTVSSPSATAGAISINSNNEVTVKPRFNSLTAFQVQNLAGSSVFSVDSSNNVAKATRMLVGTGTYSSSYSLSITDTAIPIGAYRQTSSTTADLLDLYSDVGGTANLKFKVQANGNIFTDGSTTIGTPADVAENYETAESVEPGDVVAFTDDRKLEKTTTPYTSKLAGVVSTNPGVILSGNTTGAPLALKGHVPVKVSAENGAIKPGDPLTASATKPGYAMKATGAGTTIGTALDSLASGTGTIELFVNLGYSDPSQSLQNNPTFGDINITGNATIKNLVVTDNLTTTQLTVNGHIISGGGAPTVSLGADACSGSSVSVSGTDTAGLITLTTGAGCTADGKLATVSFNKAFGATPRVTLTPASADAASVKSYVDSGSATTTNFSIATSSSSLNGSTVYKWYYQVIQ